MANCRDKCRHSQLCSKYYSRFQGEEGLTPDDCPMAWKIEDILMDAEDIRLELEREDEEVPFDDEDYDGPEVE